MGFISAGDFTDLFYKINGRGIKFIAGKISLHAASRTRNTWNDVHNNSSNWWILEAVRKRWNKLITGKEGMGYGDFKLLSAIGAWLGWSMLPLVILFSSLVGTAVGIGLIIAARLNKNIPIPFGPYLVGGALIALFWGNKLNHAYFGIF